jgi:hypothetical protein
MIPKPPIWWFYFKTKTMKKIIFYLLMCFSICFLQAQKVTVRGIARDTTKNRNFVMVVVNDTLRKHREMQTKTKSWGDDSYLELTKNKAFKTIADKKGNYEIKAKLTDTLFFYSNKYFTQKYKVADIIKKKIKVQLEHEPCVPYVKCDQKGPSNYYIFVAEKVSMNWEDDPYYCNVVSLDMGGFRCVYKIKEQIYGNYPNETIEFKAFDHYGTPEFSEYDTVLLFVGEWCGKLYHEKYQFFDLYKTKDGRWASPGDPYRFDSYQKEKLVKAQAIEFDPFLRIDISKADYYSYRKPKKYEEPYFRILGDKAVPLMGAYVEDLIKIKMKGALKERNINEKEFHFLCEN